MQIDAQLEDWQRLSLVVERHGDRLEDERSAVFGALQDLTWNFAPNRLVKAVAVGVGTRSHGVSIFSMGLARTVAR